MKIVSYYVGHVLIYLGILIVTLVITWLILRVYRIHAAYQVTTQHLNRLQLLVSDSQADSLILTMAETKDALHSLDKSLEALDRDLSPFLPLSPYLGWVPVYGGNLQALPELLAAGRDLSKTSLLVLDTFSPVLGKEDEASRESLLPYIVTNLTRINADLKQAESLLRQHQATISKLDVKRLSPGVAHRVVQLEQYLPQVISGLELVQGLPALLGVESPQTYLILAQNSDELRPSGGYINAVGYIVFDQGRIVEFVMEDSYAVDQLSEAYPYPPAPIRQYMAADYWVLRDAGWSPDFPTTARTAIDLYKLGKGISVDGVIAFDQQALPYLLGVFEPVAVEGEQVTGNNVIELMHKHWAPAAGQDFDRAWWSQRKSFMVTLAEAVRQKFAYESGTINLSKLVEAVNRALAEKHLLIYLKDPEWNDVLTKQNWTGSLASTQSDYLMVVDANLGFNKADAVIERHLNYQVTLASDSSAQAQVHLNYRHLAQKQRKDCWHEPRYDRVYEQNMARCYWDYLRLLVPAGAELISSPQIVVEGQYLLQGRPTTGEIDIAPEGANKISWGQLFLLAPGETVALDYIYTLPSGTAHAVDGYWEYSLYLQKQPGARESLAEVSITLPEGAQLLQSRPLPSSQYGAVLSYLVNIRTDEEIRLIYRLP